MYTMFLRLPYIIFSAMLWVILLVFSTQLHAEYEVEYETTENQSSHPYHNFINIFQEGKPKLYFRLRNEHFHTQENQVRDGQATMLQTRLGFETAPFLETTTYTELAHTAAFLKHRYNPGLPGVGHADRAVIPDPKGTGLTRAYAHFRGIDHTNIKFGRQFLSIDNQRFVYTSDFRHPRSVDGLMVDTRRLLPDTFLQYGYLHQQSTHLSNTRHADGRYALATHLFTANWQALLELKCTAYTYLHKNKTLTAQSNKTYGLRIAGEYPLSEETSLHYSGEAAYQEGSYNNPNRYDAGFFGFEAGGTVFLISAKVGYEFLEGHKNRDNRYFQTPLGHERNFQSWFDFQTPKEGVQDYYIKLEASPYQFNLFSAFHKLRYQALHRTFAYVIDLGISKKLDEYFQASIQYSHMNAKRAPFNNSSKLWLTLIAQFG